MTGMKASSASARETARRGHTELDPEPAAKPPTWGEALARAMELEAQGVRVEIDRRRKTIEIYDVNGELNDPADGTPACQMFYPDGALEWIGHYVNGKLHDPADGTPAWQTFYPDGALEWIGHYIDGVLVSAKAKA